jgi:hypothetical protein
VKPWGTLRRELLGMWRSVRYDLDRRAETRDEDRSPDRERLSTLLRDPRRVGAAVGVASIIVASATGTYFAVVGGLGILIADAAGVPVIPQAAPFGSFAPLAPLVPAPHAGSSKAPGHRHHKPSHRGRPATPAQPVPAPAPEIVAIDDPGPVPTSAPATTPKPVHSPVPESTGTVTPSQSPTPSPSPSVSEPSGYPSPEWGR